MKTSDKIDKLVEALAKAQGEFLPIVKDRTVEVTMKSGGKYKFEYATLDAVMAAIRPALNKHGIFIANDPQVGEHCVSVTTRVFHGDQWIESDPITFSTQAVAPQDLGGLLSYARRYSTSAFFALASEEDDDANAASGNQREMTRREPAKKAAEKPAAQSQKYLDGKKFVATCPLEKIEAFKIHVDNYAADGFVTAREANELHADADARIHAAHPNGQPVVGAQGQQAAAEAEQSIDPAEPLTTWTRSRVAEGYGACESLDDVTKWMQTVDAEAPEAIKAFSAEIYPQAKARFTAETPKKPKAAKQTQGAA